MSRHEVRRLTGPDRGLGECHGKMRFSDARRSEQDHIGSVVHEPQGLQIPNLPLVNRGLKSEVELIQRFHVGKMREL